MGRLKFFFTAWLCVSLATSLAYAAPVGNLISLKGDGTALREGRTMPLSLNMGIESGDKIMTGEQGIAVIQFTDLSTVTVGMQSKLTIDEYVFSAEAPDNNRSHLKVGSGFFQFVSGKLARDKVKLDTPVSTIGIRGTALAGEVMDDGKTLVSLVECCVDISNEHGTTSLERIGTYSEVGLADAPPSSPALTPDWWAEKAVAALGTTREALGVAALEKMPEPDSATPNSTEQESEAIPAVPRGPKTRKSFPFFRDSLIK